MEEAEDFVRRNDLETEWDEVIFQNYASYETNTTKYEIWLEDEDSIKIRLNLINLHKIAGVAVWQLGLEKPEIWDVFKEYLGTTD
jgi:spore germination protein YaaH